MGGATVVNGLAIFNYEGLSPRGRGNQLASPLESSGPGSIPAWAGQPAESVALIKAWAVYPRVGGATLTNRLAANAEKGLSPRGRGNLAFEIMWGVGLRSIPAWAGQPGGAGQ